MRAFENDEAEAAVNKVNIVNKSDDEDIQNLFSSVIERKFYQSHHFSFYHPVARI